MSSSICRGHVVVNQRLNLQFANWIWLFSKTQCIAIVNVILRAVEALWGVVAGIPRNDCGAPILVSCQWRRQAIAERLPRRSACSKRLEDRLCAVLAKKKPNASDRIRSPDRDRHWPKRELWTQRFFLSNARLFLLCGCSVLRFARRWVVH